MRYLKEYNSSNRNEIIIEMIKRDIEVIKTIFLDLEDHAGEDISISVYFNKKHGLHGNYIKRDIEEAINWIVSTYFKERIDNWIYYNVEFVIKSKKVENRVGVNSISHEEFKIFDTILEVSSRLNEKFDSVSIDINTNISDDVKVSEFNFRSIFN